jgi:pyruvate dehydrogenase E1 component alpha subunit
MPDGVAQAEGRTEKHPLPEPDVARRWLSQMLLIRRFEERAGEMYTRAKVGGFLHLAIGEEATIVGTVAAMRTSDYLMSAYRSHGHTLARGSSPDAVMAELFGREGGLCRGRGGSMHMFDLEKRFLGGYGIVGGNLPIGAGVALTADYLGTDDVTVCNFGDGASNQGTFGETMNLAALWKLPIVFLVSNNLFGMGTALERHSAVTDLQVKGEGFGVPGMECDGMDVLDTHAVMTEALRRAREDRQPVLVEAMTYRFRGHSMADPEEYRTKEQVEEYRRRDPIEQFARRLEEEDVLDRAGFEDLDRAAVERVDEAVAYADESPFPSPESLYDNVYVLGDQVRGWYAIDERGAGVRKGEEISEGAPEDRADMERYEEAKGADEKPADEAQEDED